MSEALHPFLGRFGMPQGGPEWLGALRRDAAARFTLAGFPTPKHEAWKYTNLSGLAKLPFLPNSAPDFGAAELDSKVGQQEGPRLVFVNGRHSPELSRLAGLPSGIHVTTLASALSSGASRLEKAMEGHLGRMASLEAHPLAALNAALAVDGAVVEIAPGAQTDRPLHLVFVGVPSDRPTAAFPRVLVLAGAGSRATLVETYVGRGGEAFLTDAVTEIVLEGGAYLCHTKVQDEARGAFHLAVLQVLQKKGSELVSHAFTLGAELSRNEVRAELAAEGAGCSLNGLYLPSDRQHADHQTFVDHARPGCTSRELYKGVLAGASHGVFGGRVRVRADAAKSDATQTNKNLLLSESAQVDTKPQLEIFNDDVKCAHGAAVGQLDENALFYLRSRGVGREAAKSLLTTAFVSEVMERVTDAGLRAWIDARVRTRLGGTEVRA